MLNEHNSAQIELCGASYDSEIEYEADDGYPLIHHVQIIKQTCKEGEFFYDQHGRLHIGPQWIRLDITDLLSAEQIGVLAQAISEYRTLMQYETQAENAMERAIERYLDYRATGDYRNWNAPAHYEERAVA